MESTDTNWRSARPASRIVGAVLAALSAAAITAVAITSANPSDAAFTSTSHVDLETRAADGPELELLTTSIGIVKVEDGVSMGLSDDDGWFEMLRCWDSSGIEVEEIAGITGSVASPRGGDLAAIDSFGDIYGMTNSKAVGLGTACWNSLDRPTRVFSDKEVPFSYSRRGSNSEGYRARIRLLEASEGAGNVAKVHVEWVVLNSDGFVADGSEVAPYTEYIEPSPREDVDYRSTTTASRLRLELDDGSFSAWTPILVPSLFRPEGEDVADYFDGGGEVILVFTGSVGYTPSPQ